MPSEQCRRAFGTAMARSRGGAEWVAWYRRFGVRSQDRKAAGVGGLGQSPAAPGVSLWKLKGRTKGSEVSRGARSAPLRSGIWGAMRRTAAWCLRTSVRGATGKRGSSSLAQENAGSLPLAARITGPTVHDPGAVGGVISREVVPDLDTGGVEA